MSESMHGEKRSLVLADPVAQAVVAEHLKELTQALRQRIEDVRQLPSSILIAKTIDRGFTKVISALESGAQRPSVEPKALEAEDAARYLGIKTNTLEYLVRNRKIRYVQVGDQRGRVFKVSDLDDFLKENTQFTAQELISKKGRRSRR